MFCLCFYLFALYITAEYMLVLSSVLCFELFKNLYIIKKRRTTRKTENIEMEIVENRLFDNFVTSPVQTLERDI